APAPAPQPPAPAPGDMQISGTIADAEPLPAAPEFQSVVSQGVQYTQNLRGLYTAMEPYTSGPDALYDPTNVKQCEGAVAYIDYLLEGANNPYSLARISAGGSNALNLNHDERQLLALLLANDPAIAQLRDSNLRLQQAMIAATNAGFAASGYPAARLLRNADYSYYNRGAAHFQTISIVNGELNYPSVHPFSSPLNLTGLDRANNLAATLSWGQSLSNASTFMSYSLQIEPLLTLEFNQWAGKAFQGKTMFIGNIGRVIKIYTAIKLG
ncbi:MAG: hypothetical protein V4555_10505, partial [Acidobacteriota bacterium]